MLPCSIRSRFPIKSLFSEEDGVAAIEFAIVMPIFIIILFGIITFGIYFIAAQSIQHAVNEAARASVAGITPAERDQLARRKLQEVMASLPLVTADAMSVSTSEAGGDPPSFEVDINYDASHLGLPTVAHIIGLDLHTIERRATVQYGGF